MIILNSTERRGRRRKTRTWLGQDAARTRIVREPGALKGALASRPPRCALNWFESTSEKNSKPSELGRTLMNTARPHNSTRKTD